MSLITNESRCLDVDVYADTSRSVRNDLVERIRKQICDGTYDTDKKVDVCIEKLLHIFQNTPLEDAI
jgi:anti-sigma28 factor (negative regulator of flagellin synthesis)